MPEYYFVMDSITTIADGIRGVLFCSVLETGQQSLPEEQLELALV
jgi:hypothetical protein